GQYDPGNSLAEEALATTVVSSIVGLGYGLYSFFSSSPKVPELDSTNGLSQKLKMN
ncbi:TPA: type IV secretion protein Dot, partial [Legionella pneumophila]